MKTEEIEDVNKMKHHDSWPLWPILPVKRYMKGGVQTGVLFADGTAVVYLNVDIFDVDKWAGRSWKSILQEHHREVYSSYEELVSLGWKVD